MEIGKIYLVNSQRKGTFTGKLIHESDDFASFEITHGVAEAMLDYNIKGKGEEVSVRKSLCNFTVQP